MTTKKITLIIIISVLALLNIMTFLLSSNLHAGMIFQALIVFAVPVYIYFFKKIRKGIHIAVGAVLLIVLSFAAFLMIYGMNDSADYGENAVIVPGAGIDGETVRGSLARRLDKAAEYYGKNNETKIVVCGGQGPQESITEALAMERYLIGKGVPEANIIKEEKSVSTYENVTFAKEILDKHFPQGFSCVVITNDYHIYRTVRIAEDAGITANHMHVGTVWYTLPANYTREMLAVMKMWLFPPK